MAPKSSLRRLCLFRPQNQNMSQRCGFFNVPSWVMEFKLGLTGWVGWRDGRPGHGADGEGVQSGTLALLLGMWRLRSQRILKGGYQNALPATHAALGFFRAKFTCGESSASLDVSHLWRRQPLARNQTKNEESKASLTSSLGRWAIRRTSAWSMYGLQIQINFHQKTNNNQKSVLHSELPEIQSLWCRIGVTNLVGQKPHWDGGA